MDLKTDHSPQHKSNSAIPPRDTLIQTAVTFLQNPRVKGTPLENRKAFLVKKGLTDEEVAIAIQRVGALTAQNELSQQVQPLIPSYNTGSSMMYHPPSIWKRIYRISSTVVIVAIALYGVQQFYKLYIEPWLYGYQKKDRLIALEEQLLEVNRSLSQLQKSMATLEGSIMAEKEISKQNELERDNVINPISFAEMRNDVTTIKSLLLNRHQFPDAPKIYTGIPSWQLQENLNDKLGDLENSNKINLESENPKNNAESTGEETEAKTVIETDIKAVVETDAKPTSDVVSTDEKKSFPAETEEDSNDTDVFLEDVPMQASPLSETSSSSDFTVLPS